MTAIGSTFLPGYCTASYLIILIAGPKVTNQQLTNHDKFIVDGLWDCLQVLVNNKVGDKVLMITYIASILMKQALGGDDYKV